MSNPSRLAREPVAIDARLLRDWPLPRVDGEHGKEERGRVFVVGGSREIPGAVILAAEAALRAGAGKLLVATAESVAAQVAVALPESRVIGLHQSEHGELAEQSCQRVLRDAEAHDAVLVGPGMMDPVAGIELLAACLRMDSPPVLVVDAAPLIDMQRLKDALRRVPAAAARVILTPHAGEAARLCGIDRDRVCADRLGIARHVAAELGVVVALKGPSTYIASPDGRAFVNTAGNPGLGTSGSGDVLAGILAGLAARGAEPLQAAVLGTHLHGLAGDALARKIGPLGYLAREIARELPGLLAALDPTTAPP
jgi:ADP-dependent NAD(P)H-hydrate dehydratase